MKENGRALEFGYIIECFVDGADDRYTLKQMLEKAIDELKRHPQDCIAKLEEAVSDTIELLAEEGVCPECGGRLTTAATGEDTYVPYGETAVSLHDGYQTECERCGYIAE